MRNFADQSMDVAQLILGHSLEFIGENGLVVPFAGEMNLPEEPGHLAYAMAAYVETSGQDHFGSSDLTDEIARCVAAQFYFHGDNREGNTYALLALLMMGVNLERNGAWQRLLPETQQSIEKWLLERSEGADSEAISDLVRAIARYSFGFSKKDDTDRLLDDFILNLKKNASGGFFDAAQKGMGGLFGMEGIRQFVLLREALQYHANAHVRERRLPALRTHAERYLRFIADLLRIDGSCWVFGRGAGFYGQLVTIAFLVFALADGWIEREKRSQYVDLISRLFQNFFMQHLDQDHGLVLIRDRERDICGDASSVQANFDAVRLLSIWSRFAASQKDALRSETAPQNKSGGKYISFDRCNRKEQGLLLYSDGTSGLEIQLPLISGNGTGLSTYMAYPHCPGVFDGPVNSDLPVLLPELTINGVPSTPSFYGKNVSTGLGLKREFQFRYEQPDLISNREELLNNLCSCQVQWSFEGSKVQAEFLYRPQKAFTVEKFRYVIALAAPYSRWAVPGMLALGNKGLRPEVIQDDFQGDWFPLQSVEADVSLRTHLGKIHYLQIYGRELPLIMKPGRSYRFALAFSPDIVRL